MKSWIRRLDGEAAGAAVPDWLDVQVPFQRYRVEIEPGIKVHVMEQGDGRPVVMFHGNPTLGFLYRESSRSFVVSRFD